MLTLPQIVNPVREYFAPGIYAREMTMYPGTVTTGYVHRFPQLNILSKGRLLVRTEDGIKDISAPFTVVSPAGTKRIAYAVEESLWTTILQTDLTDYDAIKKHFIIETEEEYTEWLSQSQQLSLA